MTFDVTVLRISFDSPLPRGNLANFYRGYLGQALRQGCSCEAPSSCSFDCDYKRIFHPARNSHAPSGLRDPLRPFVLRARKPGELTIHLFTADERVKSRITGAFPEAIVESGLYHVGLQPVPLCHGNLEIRFLTPTDLRVPLPDFATVFKRARDRVSNLRAAYGPGPLDIDFKGLGERAKEIELITSRLRHREVFRKSAGTGQTHSLGGFTGTAVYRGDFSPFLGILRAARFTGIGRNTVWGNGRIALRLLP